MTMQSILVHIPGYPFSAEALMPDRGLAEAAGSLLDAGHDTCIRDYGTVEHLRQVFPEEGRANTQRLLERLLDAWGENPLMVLHTVWQVRSADRAYQARQEQVCTSIAEELASRGTPDLVAFKLDTPDDLRPAALTAAKLRHLAPNLKLVAFGPVADLYAKSLATSVDFFDCYCVGDYEVGLLGLVEGIQQETDWARIPNLVFRRGGKTHRTGLRWLDDLEKTSTEAYDPLVYTALAGNEKLKIFELEDSRGCSSACFSCPRSQQEPGLRMKPVRLLCEEMAGLGSLHGARAFHVQGDGTPMMHAGAVAQAMIGLGLDVSYSRTANLPSAQSNTFGTLHRSGCRALSFRVDTGSQRLLSDYYGRDLSVSGVEGVLRESRKAGLYTLAGLTFPCPEDDEHTEAETLRLIHRAKPDGASVALAEVLPGSLWHCQPWRFGIRSRRETAGALAKRRTRFPLPPGRWQAPPGPVGPMSAGQAMQQRESLLGELESMGVVATVTPQLVLLAHELGWQDRMSEFRDDLLRQFLTGDAEAIAAMVSTYNDQAGAQVAAHDDWEDERLSAAAGN